MKATKLRVRLDVSLAILVCAVAGLSSGCASQALQPGTGDVSFRLHWQGETDLDLHVVDPLERHTGMVVYSAAGSTEEQLVAMRHAVAEKLEGEAADPDRVPAGVLDVDCNASPHQICPRPIENVFWPEGTAPAGRYTFWVHLFQPILESATEREVSFTVEVRRGDRVVDVFRGTLDNELRISPIFEHRY